MDIWLHKQHAIFLKSIIELLMFAAAHLFYETSALPFKESHFHCICKPMVKVLVVSGDDTVNNQQYVVSIILLFKFVNAFHFIPHFHTGETLLSEHFYFVFNSSIVFRRDRGEQEQSGSFGK